MTGYPTVPPPYPVPSLSHGRWAGAAERFKEGHAEFMFGGQRPGNPLVRALAMGPRRQVVMARPLAKTPSVLAMPNGPHAPGRARDFIRGSSAFLTRSSRDSAVLMVSELITNAVLHGRPPIVLTVERVRAGVEVSVADDHPDGPMLRSPARTALTGRGMLVVDALATSWGVRRRPIGKSVWIRVADNEADPERA